MVDVEMFKEQAEKTAKMVCGDGRCIACYDCGHSNHTESLIPQFGEDTTCPLEKYNVTPDTRSYPDKLRSGDIEQLTDEGLFSVCACCDYATPVEDGDYITLDRSDDNYKNHCLDCPVNMTRETMVELAAEAAMS